MALAAVRAHGGDRLVYVGEWRGCTADDAFHSELERGFDIERVHEIPRWPNINDRLFVLRRK